MSTTLILQAGTVCGFEFSDTAASVICKEMGYVNMTHWISSSYPYTWDIQDSYPIVLDYVSCSEEDVSFSDCSFDTEHYCGHGEDVFLVCGRPGKEYCVKIFIIYKLLHDVEYYLIL